MTLWTVVLRREDDGCRHELVERRYGTRRNSSYVQRMIALIIDPVLNLEEALAPAGESTYACLITSKYRRNGEPQVETKVQRVRSSVTKSFEAEDPQR